MKPTKKSISGTSFHDTTIVASVKQIIEICGEPYDESNTGKDKVNYEWIMETEDGDSQNVFTIYDWKEYRPITLNERIIWHIGGHNRQITEQAKSELINSLK
jgi:hypothetical protein